jgi:hypothetical protein
LDNGAKPRFADAQQLKAGEQLPEAHQAPFVLGLDQLMRQQSRGGEPDPKILLASASRV